jgi:hypothetical protein
VSRSYLSELIGIIVPFIPVVISHHFGWPEMIVKGREIPHFETAVLVSIHGDDANVRRRAKHPGQQLCFIQALISVFLVNFEGE